MINSTYRNFPPEAGLLWHDPPPADATLRSKPSLRPSYAHRSVVLREGGSTSPPAEDKVGRARRPCRAVCERAAHPEGSPYLSEAETVAPMRVVRLGPSLNRFFIILCFLALSCVLGKALAATNETINAASSVAADARTFDAGALPPALASTQRGEQGERDPFWPIGYMPPSKPGGTVAPANINGAEPGKENTRQVSSLSGMLKIGGVIRKGGKFYATINGFTVQTGEVVTAVADGEVYKFIVEKIDLKKVQIKPVGR